MIGTRLGRYEVTGKLGEGGMGEVWRAMDTRLDRQVAIKVLPAAFTADKDRLARFEREAKLLAQLHHPNIASIFGLEESDGVRALVMELVDGEDLSAHMAHGPLPVDEALQIARQIAEALEAAHEKGIVHRDLKPANVKGQGQVSPDGNWLAYSDAMTVARGDRLLRRGPTAMPAALPRGDGRGLRPRCWRPRLEPVPEPWARRSCASPARCARYARAAGRCST